MKRRTRVLSLLLSLMMLLSLSACGSKAAEPFVREILGEDTNALVQKDFASPLEYYRAVEQRRSEELMTVTNLSQFNSVAESGFGKADIQLSLNQSALDRDLLNLITENVGFDLSWFQSLGLSYTVGKQGDLSQAEIGLRLNDTDIVNLSAIVDMASSDMYFSIPILNESWVGMNMADLMRQYGAGFDLQQLQEMVSAVSLSPEAINSLVKRYSELVLNNIDKVGVSEGTVSAGGLENSCTIAYVKLEGEDFLRVAKAFLDAAEQDPDVEKLIYYFYSVSNGATGGFDHFHATYPDLIRDARQELESTSPEEIDLSILMDVYIDAKGEILGRRVDIRSEDETQVLFSFLTARDGDKLGLDAQFSTYDKDSSGSYTWDYETTVKASGNGTFTGDGKLAGSFQVSIYHLDDWNGDRDELNLPAFTANVNGTLGKDGFLGDLELIPTSQLLDKICEEMYNAPDPVVKLVRSLTLSLSNRSSQTTLDSVCVLRSNGNDLLTLRMTGGETQPFAITPPTGSVDVYSWVGSLGPVSLNNLINKLLEAGVPSSLLNGIMG